MWKYIAKKVYPYLPKEKTPDKELVIKTLEEIIRYDMYPQMDDYIKSLLNK